jgi:hypothetical protein
MEKVQEEFWRKCSRGALYLSLKHSEREHKSFFGSLGIIAN